MATIPRSVMLEHRFREFFAQPAETAVAVAASPSFVPCPVLMGYSPAQQSFVAEVYRLAQELTEAQLRQPTRTFPPAFSLN